MNPPVALVIPIYNGASYLHRCIGHVQELRSEVDEVIFVDDGSTDSSAALVTDLAPWATLIRQENRGLAGARNAGIRHVTSEFVQFLDVDDTVEPNKISNQLRVAVANNADVVYSDWRMVIVKNGEFIYEPIQPAFQAGDMLEALLLGWWAPPIAYLFRRGALNSIGGFDENLRVWEDYDLFLRLAIAGKRHAYASQALSNYHRYLNVKSLARRNERDNIFYRRDILHKAMEQVRNRGMWSAKVSQAFAVAFHRVARGMYNFDVPQFSQLVRQIYQLDARFRPTGTRAYRLMVAAVGLRAAEFIASSTRRLRHSWNGSSRGT